MGFKFNNPLAVNEDRPTPKAVYNYRVYLCAAIASFASCMIGYDSAFIGTTIALPSFRSEFKFDSYLPADLALLQANIVSVYQAGAFFGSLFAYVTSWYLGRRWSLIIYSLVFSLGAGMMLGANGDRGLSLIIAGRVLAGVGVGACSNMVPIYCAELSPPPIRGRLVGIYELGWQIGGLVGFWINYGLTQTMAPSHTQWIIPFAVQLIPSGLLFIGAFWLPESPRWLFSKGRRDEAMKNLCWLRQLEPTDIYMIEEVKYVDDELERYNQNIGPGFWAPFVCLKQGKVQYRLFLGGMMFLWQNGSGINAINYYSPTVFKSIGITGTSTGFLTTGIFGVVKTAITIIFILFLIETVGRRRLLIIGSVGGSLCMWFIGAYIKVANPAAVANTGGPMTSGGIAAVFFFYLWTAFYSPTWNPLPWVYNSEMFDENSRSIGQASAAANNWFWNFIISRFTPQMFLTMGYGVYFFFASLMIMSATFVFFLMPETKGLPLEAMNRLFEVKPTRKAHAIVLEELRAQEEEFRHNAGIDSGSVEEEKHGVAKQQEQV
ncbi:general substrate transporter [Microdochium trichocladiopsis]|uniref:Quinate transporter n=1 Tax=Microdochium trichocladiopsis TaxID=1682393 RepID=A0A9P8Y4B1_9PEZI|nr:general substrate transporter [Microdochium trichocladiopsis]KAH7028800.1 general substrate transporter [Microdochium trichocladiopsis]